MEIKRPALYIVGTPIGNLEDMSPRGIFTLKEVDFIAAEDTRVTAKLLNAFDIKKPLVSYYEHNIRDRGIEIINRLKNGECCALVTDAGMPAISDPGEDLVKLCASEDIPVFAVPGPSAVIAALAISGLSTGRFTFEGFLSKAGKTRRQHLEELKNEKRTMVFYEAPHKLMDTLNDLLMALGDRNVSIAREMTKIYEEVIRTTLSGAIQIFKDKKPKGEFVLVIEGAKTEEKPFYDIENPELRQSIKDKVINLVERGLTKKEAIKKVALEYNLKRNQVYEICFKK